MMPGPDEPKMRVVIISQIDFVEDTFQTVLRLYSKQARTGNIIPSNK
jgi:hypothetical protein